MAQSKHPWDSEVIGNKTSEQWEEAENHAWPGEKSHHKTGWTYKGMEELDEDWEESLGKPHCIPHTENHNRGREGTHLASFIWQAMTQVTVQISGWTEGMTQLIKCFLAQSLILRTHVKSLVWWCMHAIPVLGIKEISQFSLNTKPHLLVRNPVSKNNGCLENTSEADL